MNEKITLRDVYAMSDFTYYNRIKDDGYEQTNRLENIEDQQCDVCLKTLVSDWHIQESFKMTNGLHAICFSCSNEFALKLQEIVKEIGLINLIQFRMESILKEISPPNKLSESTIEFKIIEIKKLQKALQSLVEESKIIDKS